MPERINDFVRGIRLASRWSLAPLALGLAAALLIVMVQFFRELVHAITGFAEMDDSAVMIAVLKLVDLALIANLVVMQENALRVTKGLNNRQQLHDQHS